MESPATQNETNSVQASEPLAPWGANTSPFRMKTEAKSIRSDLKAATVLTFVLFLFLLAMHLYIASTANPELGSAAKPFSHLYPQFLALGLCFTSSIVGRLAISERFETENPVASVLAGILIRMMFLLGAIAFSTATKWTAHNLFASTMVGCYFSFLALESSLAIKRTSTRRRF